MPEMPEVQALAEFLAERTEGHAVTSARVVAIAALKTFDPPLHAIEGRPIASVGRHGKFLDVELGGADAPGGTPAGEPLHLVFHLARAGWLRWYDQLPTTALRPGRSPIALRVRLDDGAGFDLTEAGTKKSLAVYVVRDPADVPGVARLGPDPMADDFTLERFAEILDGRRTRIKGLLRDQSVLAGIGNAYSDEILHAAKMSPYKIAASLDPAEVERLYAAMRGTLGEALAEASGKPAAELKDAKRRHLRVHGRTGQACPVCGDTIRQVEFHDSTFQYCPTCQTGGTPLADRVLSRLVK
ncbi:Fpg/Nei family DNA glycosylase [Agromyces kandeliae]|uniref:Fpg/Nei family DNA glycosylase n=1 Tax=Agromyces kandeliae TaxID=2666141 RepID=A0A6L5R7U3_9MICO|nr:DNA-formamidopyrimidine glycosylase family protein [Agromyces kandeliae]MRX45447.1 Fpg/Nei family DNA glycosylase [Agromyces kandeliae]